MANQEPTRITVALDGGFANYTLMGRVLASATRGMQAVEIQIEPKNDAELELLLRLADTDARYTVKRVFTSNYLPPHRAVLFTTRSVGRQHMPGLKTLYQTPDVRICTAK